MSAAEIADNKWELQATKAPVGTTAGIASLLLMCGFAGFFVWIVGFSVIAIVTPKKEDSGLASEYEKMKAGAPAAEGDAQKVEAE
jgi:hypothetical protein